MTIWRHALLATRSFGAIGCFDEGVLCVMSVDVFEQRSVFCAKDQKRTFREGLRRSSPPLTVSRPRLFSKPPMALLADRPHSPFPHALLPPVNTLFFVHLRPSSLTLPACVVALLSLFSYRLLPNTETLDRSEIINAEPLLSCPSTRQRRRIPARRPLASTSIGTQERRDRDLVPRPAVDLLWPALRSGADERQRARAAVELPAHFCPPPGGTKQVALRSAAGAELARRAIARACGGRASGSHSSPQRRRQTSRKQTESTKKECRWKAPPRWSASL